MHAARWSRHRLHAFGGEPGSLAKAAPPFRKMSAKIITIRMSFPFGWSPAVPLIYRVSSSPRLRFRDGSRRYSVKSRDAARFGPQGDPARMRQCLVVPREDPAPVEIDGEALVLHPNRQRVPRVGSYIRIDADDFFRDAIFHHQKQRSASKRVDFDEVVIFRRSHSQREAAAFIGRAGKRLETQRDVAVL